MIRLSIIIPVFGVEKFIARCLDSVYKINLPEEEFEVICVDDCSPDSSVSIIEEYRKRHNNLIILRHETNKRQGGARNTGIRYAKGEYLLFVDADDRIPEYDVSKMLTYIQNNDLELLLGAAEIYKNNGKVLRWGNSPLTESRTMTGPEVFKEEYIHKIAFGVVWMAIYKTELASRIAPFQESIQYEDTDWTLRCAYEARRLQYLPVVIYNYMENDGSTTKTTSISKLVSRVKQGLRIWDWAQTTTQYHDDVIISVEDYCTWNLRCLRSLRFYNASDRRLFFRSFSNEEITTMKNWTKAGSWMAIISHPVIANVTFSILYPAYRFGFYIKKRIKD